MRRTICLMAVACLLLASASVMAGGLFFIHKTGEPVICPHCKSKGPHFAIQTWPNACCNYAFIIEKKGDFIRCDESETIQMQLKCGAVHCGWSWLECFHRSDVEPYLPKK